MFNWFKKEKQQPALTREDVKTLLREVLQEEIAEPVEEEPVEELIAQPSDSDNTNEPVFTLKSIGFDPEKGIRLETDWNAAFVQLLRDNGYTGTSDEQIVQKYVALVTKQIADKLDPNGTKPNEFV